MTNLRGEIEKICSKCKRNLPISKFSKNGKCLQSICKNCRAKHDAIYRSTSYFKEKRRKYENIPAMKISKKARNKARQALRSGRIKRLSCIVCGDKKTEMHHFDYSKPLEVIWFCHKHHRELHYWLYFIASPK